MRITLSHVRAIVGNDLDVAVQAEGEEQISRVTVQYDGFNISDESINPPVQEYEQAFTQQGDAGLDIKHTLVAKATYG